MAACPSTSSSNAVRWRRNCLRAPDKCGMQNAAGPRPLPGLSHVASEPHPQTRRGPAWWTCLLVGFYTLALGASTAPVAAHSADPVKLAEVAARMKAFVDDGTISGAVTLLARHDRFIRV